MSVPNWEMFDKRATAAVNIFIDLFLIFYYYVTNLRISSDPSALRGYTTYVCTCLILQEKEIVYLKEQIQWLHQNITNNTSQTVPDVNKEEFEKLQQENIKLKHRIAILTRVGFQQQPNSTYHCKISI